jgi:mannose-6-phosphate isomerase-like protein (cupin superfamily)
MSSYILLSELILPKLLSSHDVGMKTVFVNFKNSFNTDGITQIATASLNAGEIIESHSHESMNEYFFILEGEGEFIIDSDNIHFIPNTFIGISKKTVHSVRAITEVKFFYFGIKVN